MYFKRFLSYIYKFFLTEVKIDKMRIELSAESIKDKWGGKPISNLPVYNFFELYINGNSEDAFKGMFDYYYNDFMEYGNIHIDKKKGGKKGGTLYKKIYENHEKAGIKLDEKLSNLDVEIVKQTIQERVNCRFNMIESIKKHGYTPSYDFVQVKKKDDLFYITAGHHRVSAMDLLGYKSVFVAVDNPYFLRKIYRFFRLFNPKQVKEPC